jgi:hypothetical protein
MSAFEPVSVSVSVAISITVKRPGVGDSNNDVETGAKKEKIIPQNEIPSPDETTHENPRLC